MRTVTMTKFGTDPSSTTASGYAHEKPPRVTPLTTRLLAAVPDPPGPASVPTPACSRSDACAQSPEAASPPPPPLAAPATPVQTPPLRSRSKCRYDGATPRICNTVSGVSKSRRFTSVSGAPNSESARKTRSAFSELGRTHRSMSPVARGCP